MTHRDGSGSGCSGRIRARSVIWPQQFRQLRIFPDVVPPAKVLPIDELVSRYYLRLMATDRPGVLADVTDALGKHHISVAAVLQQPGQSALGAEQHLRRLGNLELALLD